MPESDGSQIDSDEAEVVSADDLMLIENGTLRAWETLRSGLQKLLLVYPAKACKYCSEVQVGPGRKARLRGVFKYQSWHGGHFWKKAEVDDPVPLKIVWFPRHQDPLVLVIEGHNFYDHAPSVVSLCVQAGAVTPAKYHCMTKIQGQTTSFPISLWTSS